MTTRLILVNVMVFILQGLLYLGSYLSQEVWLYDAVANRFSVPAALKNLIWQPWSMLTYMFMHSVGGILHILFNMLWFYWFGQIFMNYLSDRKILPLYLGGGIAGALLYILLYNLIPLFRVELADSYMIGASASVLAVVVGTATLVPNHQINLLFIGTVRIKYIALFSIVLDLLMIPNGNAGGHIAHLGGAAFGFFFIKQLQTGNDLSLPFDRFWLRLMSFLKAVKEAFSFKKKPRHRVVHKNKEKAKKPSKPSSLSKQEQVDIILDKISQSGYESLTEDEKAFLFKVSKEDR